MQCITQLHASPVEKTECKNIVFIKSSGHILFSSINFQRKYGLSQKGVL